MKEETEAAGFTPAFRAWWMMEKGYDPGDGLPHPIDQNYPSKELREAHGTFVAGMAASASSEARLRAEAEVRRLRTLIDTPQTEDWVSAVRLEAAHQIERWGTEDAGKTDANWFWLVGHLAVQARHAAIAGNITKALHHTISTGAALLNWHRALTGESTLMRPGIEPPTK